MTMSVWMRAVGWGLTVVPRLVRCRNRAGAGLGRAWLPRGSVLCSGGSRSRKFATRSPRGGNVDFERG
ncbi:hypothetical protein CORC01_09932 [Colletotrichum orchidophilum]|uniref:Uncharacterized protein n=1 Tax=Colletotrichum orchidophilum TaxID=1209926 RepID=A0A1G4B048_9PEZI|nr:uncharacterized protein CORC01_09932 [Colletotrichum orchidophilum]OHE94715.1 hypothetical protein CORC01_09932 [Colletotrichum orchidophilum]